MYKCETMQEKCVFETVNMRKWKYMFEKNIWKCMVMRGLITAHIGSELFKYSKLHQASALWHLQELMMWGFYYLLSNVQDVQDETITLTEGLDLVVSHNRKTMKGVANLVLAVNRMKMQKQELSDDELCGVIMDSDISVVDGE